MIGEVTSAEIRYACPKCKIRLMVTEENLFCSNCGRSYPVLEGIPDFIFHRSPNPALFSWPKL